MVKPHPFRLNRHQRFLSYIEIHSCVQKKTETSRETVPLKGARMTDLSGPARLPDPLGVRLALDLVLLVPHRGHKGPTHQTKPQTTKKIPLR
jgi:hypothetical protein